MNSRFLIVSLGIALGVASTGSACAEEMAATPAATAQGSSTQPGTDAWITTKVKADLMATKDIPGTAISVSTMNGVVTLAGIAPTRIRSRSPWRSPRASRACAASTRRR